MIQIYEVKWWMNFRRTVEFFNNSLIRAHHICNMMSKQSLGSLIFYAVTSTSMAFINKALLSSYGFNFPFFIMAGQMLISGACVETLRATEFIHVHGYTIERGKMFALPSFCYAVNAVLSLVALNGVSIPIYGVIKRTSPLVSLVMTVFILKKGWPNHIITFSVVVLVAGCIIAALGDLTLNLQAYIACGLSVFAQALYQVLVQRCSEDKLQSSEILLLNSYNTLPVCLIGTLCTSELQNLMAYTRWHEPSLQAMLFLVMAMGAVLNYSLFLCCALNSALTTSLVGPMKSGVQTGLGIFMFGGIKLNLLTGIGIGSSLMGGVLYVFGKYVEEKRKKRPISHGNFVSVQSSAVALDSYSDEKLLPFRSNNGVTG